LKRHIIILSFLFNIVFAIIIAIKIFIAFNEGGELEKNWFDLSRNSHFSNLQITENDIVVMGASIMRYAEWNELISQAPLKNRAVAGFTSEDVLLLLPAITQHNPGKIILMVGFNNLNRTGNVDKLVDSYRNIMRHVEGVTSKTKLIILSITPVKDNVSQFDNINSKILMANKKIKTLCINSRCTYLDVYKSLLDANGELHSKYTYDGIHLNGDAYEILSDKLNVLLDE